MVSYSGTNGGPDRAAPGICSEDRHMSWSVSFFLHSVVFGVVLALDAFSVSVANGINEPRMRPGRACTIAGVFAFFQTAMPLLGWWLTHLLAENFHVLQRFIPWFALVILVYLGGRMILQGLHPDADGAGQPAVGTAALLVQGVATSIDALSVGLTIAENGWCMALVEALIIGVETFGICMFGLYAGRQIGRRVEGKATVIGGVCLVLIGMEVFLRGVFF